MIAIITEKPSVGRDIARVLGATDVGEGYIEGNGYMITWAFGHLVSLYLPEDYGIDSYNINSLPIFPDPFELKPRKKGDKTDASVKKQLDIIKRVFDKSDSIIVATDAGRAGELIFRYIYNYLECRKPYSRLWISSLTDSAIKQGMGNLKPGEEYDSLYLAAEAQNKADWLLGINASRALNISSGDANNSLGRVQTPTLALVCKRYYEHYNFVSRPYWQHIILLKKDDFTFQVKGIESYFDKEDAEKIFDHLKTYPVARISGVESKEVLENPPLLYDLTNLQKEANNKYGFSAQKTLNIAQKLYEGRAITYPRTGSRYIPKDVFKTVPQLLESIKNIPDFSNYATRLSAMKLNTRSVNDKKITDHHALLITGIIPERLSEDDELIYKMIIVRMLQAFSKPCKKDVTEVEICCDSIKFKAIGWSVKENGWKDVLGENTEKEGQEDNQLLPKVSEGDSLAIESYNMIQKSTKPKPIYTEATLLSAMENAGKDSEDKKVRSAMKDCGLGTPATRAGIIETLFTRGYIERDKKTILPSSKGKALYELVKDMQIADVELTGWWEKALSKIEKTPEYYSTFLDGIHVYVRQVVDEIVSIVKAKTTFTETPHICPRCRLGKITVYQKLAKCNYSKCKFLLYREICGKSLTDEQINGLFKTGQTPVITGFKSKKGKSFDASIILNTGGNLAFQFKVNEKEQHE